MKKLHILAYLIFSGMALLSNAQDIILKKDGTEISAKIIELNNVFVKYKNFSYQDGPTVTLSKEDIFYIKHQNGEKEIIGLEIKKKISVENEQNYNPSYKEMLGVKDYSELKRIKWSKFAFSDLEFRITKLEAFDLTGIFSERELRKVLDTLNLYQKDIIAIDISNCELADLPIELNDFRNLKYLIAKSNELTSLNFKTFQSESIKLIDVSNNKISGVRFPKESLGQDSSLKHIDLSYNQISSFPKELAFLKNLSSINLSNNIIDKFSINLNEMSKLNYLNISNNNLESLPIELFSLNLLTNLNISNNSITFLQPEIVNLSNLIHLSISNNSFAISDPIFINFKKLKTLEICNIGLMYFPNEICNLTELRSINISNNHNNLYNNSITEIPNNIAKLVHLEQFSCSAVGLVNVSKELLEIGTLKEIKLNDNKLTSLPIISKEMIYLKNLEMSNCNINDDIILNLRYNIPSAKITYLEPEINSNYSIPAFSDTMYIATKQEYKNCIEKKTSSCLNLGTYLMKYDEFLPIAIKSFKLSYGYENCTYNALLGQLKIADLYNDVSNTRPYFRMRRRRTFKDYDDFISNFENSSFSVNLYKNVCNCNSENDKEINKLKNVGCKQAYEFYFALSKELNDIYEKNKSEMKSLVSDIALFKITAADNKSQGARETNPANKLIYLTAETAANITVLAKENRLRKLESQNSYLEPEIKSYSSKAISFTNLMKNENE